MVDKWSKWAQQKQLKGWRLVQFKRKLALRRRPNIPYINFNFSALPIYINFSPVVIKPGENLSELVGRINNCSRLL
jgi:hypothetical protein